MTEKKSQKRSDVIVKRKKLNINQWQLISLAVIPALFVLVFSYLPMFGVIIAFKDYRYNLGIWGSDWVGLDNFTYFFKTNDFWTITKNTLVMNFGFIFIGMIAAIALAVLFYEVRGKKAIKTYQTLAIFPHFLSWVVVGCIGYAFLQPSHGLVNAFLANFGIEPIDWYSKPEVWPAILIFVSVWKHVGMDCIIYYATMMGIDYSLYEAAAIDGANKWKQIIHITIPSLIPIIVILGIMKIGNIFRADFGLFYQMTRDIGALYETTDVLDTYIYRTMRVFGDMSTSAAMGLLQSVVGFVLVIITNAITRRVDEDLSLF
ncbi:MAG: sugar ABC transporter permease [Clostridia bacterium]|nr:sugar ABC transporter permease [Clostridia bacterium]